MTPMNEEVCRRCRVSVDDDLAHVRRNLCHLMLHDSAKPEPPNWCPYRLEHYLSREENR